MTVYVFLYIYIFMYICKMLWLYYLERKRKKESHRTSERKYIFHVKKASFSRRGNLALISIDVIVSGTCSELLPAGFMFSLHSLYDNPTSFSPSILFSTLVTGRISVALRYSVFFFSLPAIPLHSRFRSFFARVTQLFRYTSCRR